ncbi:MAG: hypothetical protein AVDCRST_MAG08-1595, partial [uncultured Acetobacteraceae bacterium]
DRHGQHVGQRRCQPVPPAHRRGAGAARGDGARRAGPRAVAGAAGEGARPARRHALRLRRDRGWRGSDLPLGEPHPLPRAGRGTVRADHARHPLRRIRRAGRHGRGHRAVLPRDPRCAGGRGGRHRARSGGEGPAPRVPRDGLPCAALRRPPRPGRAGRLRRPLCQAAGARAGLAGGQRLAVPLPRHRGPGHGRGAVHRGTRSAEHDAPDVWPAARQPQRRHQQPQLRAGARGLGLG